MIRSPSFRPQGTFGLALLGLTGLNLRLADSPETLADAVVHSLNNRPRALAPAQRKASSGLKRAWPRFRQHTALFGNLHAHSGLSADVPASKRAFMSPKAAFRYAFEHGLGFLAITDHHKAVDAPGPPLFVPDDVYRRELFEVALAFSREHELRFVAVPGVEWGNTKTGNHVNVFGAKVPPSRHDILNREYDELYEWAKLNAEFVQFNHPNSWKKRGDRTVGNFGRALYDTTEAFVAAVDPVVKTMSIITSVAGGHLSGKHRHSTEKTHRKAQWERFYREYLNLGFHLSPSANQDTHGTNWGTVTAARTVAWAREVSYRGLMGAFRANRVYATEDDELVVVYQVLSRGKRYWMGETVPVHGDRAKVDLIVKVWQTRGVDGDALEEGPYTVEVVRDSDGRGGRLASRFETFTLRSSKEIRLRTSVVDGEYLYLKVCEQNGSDNPVGDGTDRNSNRTGKNGPDGLRDDLDDCAWTTPIWFERRVR